MASYDLQEPLRKIVTFSDYLERYKSDIPEKAIIYLDKIAGSAERMTRLIDDLLNFSRISRTDGQFVQTDLNKVLQDILVDFDLIIGQKKAVIRHDKLPVIDAIPVQIKQLFHNLLSNALKFANKDVAPKIEITCRTLPAEEVNRFMQEKPGPFIELRFKDNGIGFNAEFSEQIFHIFQRLNAMQEYPGTGIGLALCRRIVNYHGGEIYAESKENEGAAFIVLLPGKQP